MTASEIIRTCFAAYHARDREAVNSLLADDFTFTSPMDDHIGKKLYFERCWEGGAEHRGFKIETIFEQGNSAFVTYSCGRPDGSRFRNTEFFVTDGSRIHSVNVYFGTDVVADSPGEADIRGLLDATVKAVRAKDAAALIEHYAPDVEAFDLINPLGYHGVAEVRSRAEQWLSSFEGPFGYELRDLTVSAGADTAFCHSLNHVKGTTTDGREIDMWWRATVCLRRLDGKWFITHLHSSVPFDMETGLASLDLRP